MGQSWSSILTPSTVRQTSYARTVSIRLSDLHVFEEFRGPLRYYCYLTTPYPEHEDAEMAVIVKSLLDDSWPAVQMNVSLHEQEEKPFICVYDGQWNPLYQDLVVTTDVSWTYLSLLDSIMELGDSVEKNRPHITLESTHTLFQLLHTKLVMGPRNEEVKNMKPTLENTRSLVDSYKFSLDNEQ